jgi:DNA-directed RNA polymerase subunit RPC12/RpoP
MPFLVGERYWVPFGGPSKKGCYIQVAPEDVIAAYKNPADFKLEGVKPMAKFNKIFPKIFYAVPGWVEETFHYVQETNPKTNKKYAERQRCTGHGCKFCKDGLPKVFGKKVYFVFARTHWDGEIFAWNERINSTCKCGGFIHNPYYKCSNCGEVLVDVTQHCWKCHGTNVGVDPDEAVAVCQDCQAEWSVYESDNPDIKKKVDEEIRCPKCGHEDIPVPVPECSQCDSPKSYGIFDCQMKISMIKTSDGNARELHIEDVKIREPDERLFSAQDQGDRDAAAIAQLMDKDKYEAEEVAKNMKKAYDLNRIFTPPTPEEQAKLLGVANPFKGGTESGYKHYSRQTDSGTDEGEGGDEGEGYEADDQQDDGDQEESVVRQPPARRGRIALRR